MVEAPADHCFKTRARGHADASPRKAGQPAKSQLKPKREVLTRWTLRITMTFLGGWASGVFLVFLVVTDDDQVFADASTNDIRLVVVLQEVDGGGGGPGSGSLVPFDSGIESAWVAVNDIAVGHHRGEGALLR